MHIGWYSHTISWKIYITKDGRRVTLCVYYLNYDHDTHRVLSVNSAWFSNVPLTLLTEACFNVVSEYWPMVLFEFIVYDTMSFYQLIWDQMTSCLLMHECTNSCKFFVSFSTIEWNWSCLLFCLRCECSQLQWVHGTFIMITISACCTAVDNSSTALDLFFRMLLTNTLPFFIILKQTVQIHVTEESKVNPNL